MDTSECKHLKAPIMHLNIKHCWCSKYCPLPPPLTDRGSSFNYPALTTPMAITTKFTIHAHRMLLRLNRLQRFLLRASFPSFSASISAQNSPPCLEIDQVFVASRKKGGNGAGEPSLSNQITYLSCVQNGFRKFNT